MLEHGADLGIALDGDADRVIIADENGEMVDGDQILALIAQTWHQAGTAARRRIVATVMSNLGLERYLAGQGLTLHRTKVGDRYVAEHMRARAECRRRAVGAVDPVRFRHHGDGLARGIAGPGGARGNGRPGIRGLPAYSRLPQLLKHVRFRVISPLSGERAGDRDRGSRSTMNGSGRLLIRESGTEPVGAGDGRG